jgi:hypothetical protein
VKKLYAFFEEQVTAKNEPVGFFDTSSREDILAFPDPATPIWRVPVKSKVLFHLVGATDKPRNYSFTIHGVAWPEWRFLSEEGEPKVASESAITCGTVRTFEFMPQYEGDHAYRSGMLKWAVHQGLWGILRVVNRPSDFSEDLIQEKAEGTVKKNTMRNRKTGLILMGVIIGIGLFTLWKTTKDRKEEYKQHT